MGVVKHIKLRTPSIRPIPRYESGMIRISRFHNLGLLLIENPEERRQIEHPAVAGSCVN
jgi:hypothetical protein